MKIIIGLLVTILAFNVVLSLPAQSLNNDAEVISGPRRVNTRPEGANRDEDDFSHFDGVIDTGVGYPFLQPRPSVFSFNLGFFDDFEDILRRLRSRLWVFSSDSDEADDDETAIVESPFKNGNTTSTVKVIGGNRVEINETVYGDENNVLKVRVVNIRPIDGDVSDEDINRPNTATAGPKRRVDNGDDDDDGRREPLARRTETDNEIETNIDEQVLEHHLEQEEDNRMLPLTNEDNAANLNAAFVADNSLELENESVNGNIDAETNNPGNGNNIVIDSDNVIPNGDLEQHSNDSEVAALEEELASDDIVSSRFVENEGLTIENNEETEVNDNFNESAQDDDDSIDAVTVTNREVESDTELQPEVETSTEIIEDIPTTATTISNNSEFFDEISENSKNDNENNSDSNDDVAAAVDDVDEEKEKAVTDVNSSASHSNYAINKERENFSSSDDEDDAGGIEMNPTFNSEWEHLAEELANVNDKNNDLSNDIDAYEFVPIDLSNDIAVNDIAAAQSGYPLNPDAEFIDAAADVAIDGVLMNVSMQPQFEKLTIDAANQPPSMSPSNYGMPEMK